MIRGRAAAATAESAYEGVESLDQFSSEAELEEYRRGLLAKAELELGFIEREVGGRNLRVLELGMGGGRLLIALALAGIAGSATGMDISSSRATFARRWAADLQLGHLEFVAEDVLKPEAWPEGEFDLVICISNLLGYLGPVRPDAPAQVLRQAYRSLAPDGCLLLEFYQLTERRRQSLELSDNRVRAWMPLPEWDRFAYYLSDIAYDPSSGMLHHEKTFIGRDGSIDTGRVEENMFYTCDEILGWLRMEAAGEYRVFRNFASDPYSRQATQVVLLRGAPDWQPPTGTALEVTDAVLPGTIREDGLGAWA